MRCLFVHEPPKSQCTLHRCMSRLCTAPAPVRHMQVLDLLLMGQTRGLQLQELDFVGSHSCSSIGTEVTLWRCGIHSALGPRGAQG